MMSIKWEYTYSTGISLLDMQNKHFVGLINLMLEYKDNGTDHDFFCQMLWSLVSYAREHFRKEETYYGQHCPEELEEHREHHLVFLKNLNRFCADVTKEGPNTAHELCNYVRNWITHHIIHVDKAVARKMNIESSAKG